MVTASRETKLWADEVSKMAEKVWWAKKDG